MSSLLNSLFIAGLTTSVPDGFVYTDGTNFMLNGKVHYFAGANSYNLFTFGSGWNGDPVSGSLPDEDIQWMGLPYLDDHFRKMKEHGVQVVRTWGFNTNNDMWYVIFYFIYKYCF